MADNKKFYWIKLKTNFFSREDIDFLLSQKNGAEYVVLYQMLCLNTANNDGRLESKIGEILVPYNADKIVRDCKYFDIDTVNIAMALYKKLGLIYEEEDRVLKISHYDEMVGSETAWAEKKRLYRQNQKLLGNKDNVEDIKEDNVEDNVRQEYRDKSIENRDIDIRDKDNRDKNNKLILSNDDKKINSKHFEEEFEKLWSVYPNKKGKEEARKKYISYRKNGTSYEEVASGLKKYIEYCKVEIKETKYIKHGSTWFNQKCWNDEYVITNNSNKKVDNQMEILKGVHNGSIKIS